MNKKGFSLVELMIVVAIIGILSAVAIPRFIGYIRVGRLDDAAGSLEALAGYEEQIFADTGAYSSTNSDLTDLGWTLPDATDWTVAITLGGGGATYSAVATGIGKVSGYSLTITDTGLKSGTGTGNVW